MTDQKAREIVSELRAIKTSNVYIMQRIEEAASTIESLRSELAVLQAANQHQAEIIQRLNDAESIVSNQIAEKDALIAKIEQANTAEASRNIDNYKQIQQLQARVKELENALQPFARFFCSEPYTCKCHNCHARDLLINKPSEVVG